MLRRLCTVVPPMVPFSENPRIGLLLVGVGGVPGCCGGRRVGLGGIDGVGRLGGGGEVRPLAPVPEPETEFDLETKAEIRELAGDGVDVEEEEDEGAVVGWGSDPGSKEATEACCSCSVSMVTVRVCPEVIRSEWRESEVLRGIAGGSLMAAIAALCFERMS